MRPNPEQKQTDTESGRIIYLGDVRRRRVGGRKPDLKRSSLLALGLVSVVSWLMWLAVLVGLPPYRLLTYIAFFMPLFVAISSTVALSLLLLGWRRGVIPDLSSCLRRGGSCAFVVVVNLAALAAHAWTWPVGVITIAAVLMLDGAVSHRAR